MADLRQALRSAADPPSSIDEAQVRDRVRRIRRWRWTATVAAVVAIALGTWSIVGVLTGPTEVRFVEQQDGRDTDDEAAEPSWVALSDASLSRRWGPVAAWTGSRYVVWGGYATAGTPERAEADGAAYDPVTDRWRPLAAAPLPGVRNAASVWTGEELWVLGGFGGRNGYEAVTDAAAYAPDGDTWRRLPAVPAQVLSAAWSPSAAQAVVAAPDPTSGAVAVWTLTPEGDDWRRLPPLPDPPRAGGDADPDLTVVAGDGYAYVVTAGSVVAIDLAARDSWLALDMPPIPLEEDHTVAAWTTAGLLVVSDDRSAVYEGAAAPARGSWRRPVGLPLTMTVDTQVAGTTGDTVVILDTATGDGAVFHAERARWAPLPALPLEARVEAAVAVGEASASTTVFTWGGSRRDNVPFGDGVVLQAPDG